ncbi:hypothetical protein C0993_005357 [Termitomyces sp. T159_Od127]|nr:hypothetical protein C0993_005357 [Termitomyces sp. T159_Od127]
MVNWQHLTLHFDQQTWSAQSPFFLMSLFVIDARLGDSSKVFTALINSGATSMFVSDQLDLTHNPLNRLLKLQLFNEVGVFQPRGRYNGVSGEIVLQFNGAEAGIAFWVKGAYAGDKTCYDAVALIDYCKALAEEQHEKNPIIGSIFSETGGRVSSVEFNEVHTAAQQPQLNYMCCAIYAGYFTIFSLH